MAPSEARRDRWGRYLVVPPSGGKPQGYTRATTVAKTLDDQGGLMPWKAAMAMTGLMRRSGLRASLEALVSAHPETGPWYGSTESKKKIKALVEECAEAGGSADRADIGTALHAIIEQLGRGEPVTITQDSTRADVAAYRDLIEQGQVEFLREYIEATFVLDQWQVAGTADGGAVRIPWLSDKLLIADLKTGVNLEYSGQSIGVQLATYAHGDAHYLQGAAADGSQDERRAMPELDQELAVVIHLPAGEANAQLYKVDIAAGWEAFKQSMWARDWRKRKDILVPVEIEKVAPPKEEPRQGEVTPIDVGRLLLLELIKAMPAERQTALKAAWPKQMPPLKNAEHWTSELLVECTQFVGAFDVTSNAAATSSPGPSAADASDAALHSSGTDTSADRGPAGASSPGDVFTVEQWNALDADEQARRIDRGHLPTELRASRETLDELTEKVEALDPARSEWLFTRAKIAGLPNLAHENRWSIERFQLLGMLFDTAEQLTDEQLAPPDWSALLKAAGVTKAAAGREAKRLATELGIKVPTKVDDLPTDGVFAVQFANWIDVTCAQLNEADAA
jgi:hypothetical protein